MGEPPLFFWCIGFHTICQIQYGFQLCPHRIHDHAFHLTDLIFEFFEGPGTDAPGTGDEANTHLQHKKTEQQNDGDYPEGMQKKTAA